MRSSSLTTLLFVLAMLLGVASPVAAHDPGLSRARLQVLDDEIVLQTTLAQRDVESMVLLDADNDGRVSPTEFAAAKVPLESMAGGAVALVTEHGPIDPQEVQVAFGESESVGIEAHFARPRSSTLYATFPIMKRLPRGHRQHLTVVDSAGELVQRIVVDAGAPRLSLAANAPRSTSVFRDYVVEGVWHIWIGLDHVLFLLTLLLPTVLIYRQQQWQSVVELRPAFLNVLTIVTAFTVAHTVTLALAVLEIVQLRSRFVESVIAFSVLATAVNNLRPAFTGSRWVLALVFGLLHGFGFAGVLVELGLPRDAVAVALIGFSLGVEIGQMAIVVLLFPVAFLARGTSLYRRWILQGGSVAAALVASVWIVERLFGVELIGL